MPFLTCSFRSCRPAGHSPASGMIPGVQYASEQDFWVRRCHEAWKFFQAHPDGPYTYGGWDSVPEHPDTRSAHARWLRQYKPLVEDGTWAWLEVSESDLFAAPLPAQAVASVFANRDLYLVLANYGAAAVQIATTDRFEVACDSPAIPSSQWSLPARSLQILRRSR